MTSSADGNRFLFVTGVEETSSPLTLVVNWTARLANDLLVTFG